MRPEEEISHVLGIDFGTDTAILSLLPLSTIKPEILRNDLSNQKTPTCLSFSPDSSRQRLFGDLALQQCTAQKDNTVTGVLRAIGRDATTFIANTPFFFSRCQDGADGALRFQISRSDTDLAVSPEQIIAMFLAKFYQFTEMKVNPSSIVSCIVIPESFTKEQMERIKTACDIAEIPCPRLITRTASAAMTSGTKKQSEAIANKVYMFVDIGHGYASVAVYKFLENKVIEHLATECDENLGSYSVDEAIFNELIKEVKEKYNGYEVGSMSKGAIRLRAACRKLKETLSSVYEANATCENLVDGIDVKFTFTRERLERISTNIRTDIKNLILNTLQKANVEVDVCEVIGGGMRVPFVKEAILEAFSESDTSRSLTELSYTLDSMAACATGACYSLAKLYEPDGAIRRPIFESIPTVKDDFGIVHTETLSCSFDEMALAAARALHIELHNADEDILGRTEAKNKLEAFIFEMRSAAKGNRKHSELINKEECNRLVDEAENWLFEVENETKELITEKMEKLRSDLENSCGDYLAKLAEEEKRKEAELEVLSKQAAEELEKAGGKDDHDFRKLPKAERMKKVTMNKEEGNSLFKDGNVEPASLRYKRALQHCDKFFDLSEEDKREVNALKLALHMNLSMCYIKLENDEQALNALKTALEMDVNNVKALYRRATVLEKKKNFDLAKKDLLKAQELDSEDKAVQKLLARVELQIKKQKEKQKKFAQKMFQ